MSLGALGEGNHLFYGDNLDVLRGFPDAAADLIYLDPPFNSNADYNTILRTPSGKPVPAQEDAFKDTWQWDDAVSGVAVSEVKRNPDHQDAAALLDAMIGFLNKNALTAYLAMMAVRLIELHRVLKPTGSLYLHCDPTASHYLKLLLDAVFGQSNFVNEISWHRQTAKADYKQGAKHFPRVRDILLRYRRSSSGPIFNQPFIPYDQEYISSKYKYRDPDGRVYRLDNLTGPGGEGKGNAFYEVMGITRYWRYSRENMNRLIAEGRIIQTKPGTVPQYKRYLDEMPGVPCSDDWDDLDPINSQAQERLGYPTQKPLALLQRIIAASSNPGDLVLDPFCGCGTTVHAAQKLGRRWVGIDVPHVAVGLIETRLRAAFPGLAFTVHGTPMDVDAARDFFARNDSTKKEFEKWAVTRLGFLPQTKKGADGGFDGMVWFGPKEDRKAIVSVKGGRKVDVETVRSLDAVVTAQKADVGVLLSLEEPSGPARDWARQGGLFELPGFRPVPRLQLVTVEQALSLRERAVDLPTRSAPVKTAPREEAEGRQGKLL